MQLIFLSCMCQILQGLNGVINIADDVLVYGTDYESFKANVIGFLDRCVEKDTHPNPDKICINTLDLPFFRQVLTPQGLKPDLHKVEVIQSWPTLRQHNRASEFPRLCELPLQIHSISFGFTSAIAGAVEILQ